MSAYSLRPDLGEHKRPLWALACLAGRVLTRVRLSRLVSGVEAGQTVYLKSRRWYAGALICATNRFLAPGVYVLPNREWLLWEPAIYRLLYGWTVQATTAGQLSLPEIPGMVLTALLRSVHIDAQTRLDALIAATGALSQLHRLWVRFPNGVTGWLSHGDATTDNVICDSATGKARWFDFETIHDSRRSKEWRQADDLRALAYSAAARLPEEELALAAHLLMAAYTDRPILRAFCQAVERLQQRSDVFHFAQTGISYPRNVLWGEALQAELRTLDV